MVQLGSSTTQQLGPLSHMSHRLCSASSVGRVGYGGEGRGRAAADYGKQGPQNNGFKLMGGAPVLAHGGGGEEGKRNKRVGWREETGPLAFTKTGGGVSSPDT